MTATSPQQELEGAFVEAYGVRSGWDSVAHMALVAAIESRFDITLSTDDLIDLSTFPKVVTIPGNYGIAFS